MVVSDKNENIDNIQNESEDSDNQDHLDQYPGVDIVEDFARQLDELCMNAPHVPDDDDDDEDEDEDEEDNVPFGYEQLPQDEEGFGVLNSEDDYNNEEEEEDINKKDTMLENSDVIMNDIEQQQINDSSTLKSFTIAVDTSEKLPTETSDLIMNIMKNIDLPDHAIPLWAKNIPESKWMPKLEENK
ncbi:unnamed protein product [Cunninghamella echinulata]